MDSIEDRDQDSSFLKDYVSAVVTACDAFSFVIDSATSEMLGKPYGEHTMTTLYGALDESMGLNEPDYRENGLARFLGMLTGVVIDGVTLCTVPAALAVVDGAVIGGKYLVDKTVNKAREYLRS